MEFLVDSKGLHVFDPRTGKRHYIDGYNVTPSIFGDFVTLSINETI